MVEEQETSQGFLGWDRILFSHLHWTQTHFQSDPQTQWSMPMVAIRDSCSAAAAADDDRLSVVFPPNNHEGLHISNQNQPNHHSSPLPPPTRPLSSVSPPCEVNGDDPSPLARWLRFGFGFLRSKVIGIASSLRCYAATRGTFLSFRSAACATAAALLLWLLLHMKFRRQRHSRRWIRRGSEDQLLLVIKEKDKKINELLHQIAQMNQVLVDLHRVSLSKTG